MQFLWFMWFNEEILYNYTWLLKIFSSLPIYGANLLMNLFFKYILEISIILSKFKYFFFFKFGKLMIMGDPYQIVPFFQGYKKKLFSIFFHEIIISYIYINTLLKISIIPSKFKYLFPQKMYFYKGRKSAQ